VYLSSKFFQ